jgi:hypothetical protein
MLFSCRDLNIGQEAREPPLFGPAFSGHYPALRRKAYPAQTSQMTGRTNDPR